MAKEFAFYDALWKGGTVYCDKGAVCAAAALMDCLGNKFLPCAAFSSDKHGGIGCCHLPDKRVDLFHSVRGSDNAVEADILGLGPT